MFTRNHIQLTGNIAKPAESRAAGETTVTRARLLHNEAIRKADGETVERLVAVDVEIWGKRGDAFAECVTTKTPVYVEGRLQLDQWQAEDGSPRSRLLVRVEDWQFLAPRPQDANANGNANAGANAGANTGTNTTTTTNGTKTKRTNAKAGAVA
ncbi:MAG: single-stranded DNA-binding protein [Verrucomicrobiae bacterium]|nr:single-stranded DNA-binding protein [Verrucomicrobiae bacterium]